MAWLFLLLLAVPLAELWVIIEVWQQVGGLTTIGLLVAVSLTGAWLVRREGMGVLNRLNEQTARGELPTNELIDGLLILCAGALMLTPGFITDAVGLLLLIPPTRALARSGIKHRMRSRLDLYASQGGVRFMTFTSTFGNGGRRGSGNNADVIDVEGWEDPPETPRPPPQLPGDSPGSPDGRY